MHLHAYLACVCDGSHVGCDDCSYSCLLCCIKSASHVLEILIVQDNVEGEIGLDTVFRTDTHNLVKIRHLEIVGRVRTHVEFLHSEIY